MDYKLDNEVFEIVLAPSMPKASATEEQARLLRLKEQSQLVYVEVLNEFLKRKKSTLEPEKKKGLFSFPRRTKEERDELTRRLNIFSEDYDDFITHYARVRGIAKKLLKLPKEKLIDMYKSASLGVLTPGLEFENETLRAEDKFTDIVPGIDTTAVRKAVNDAMEEATGKSDRDIHTTVELEARNIADNFIQKSIPVDISDAVKEAVDVAMKNSSKDDNAIKDSAGYKIADEILANLDKKDAGPQMAAKPTSSFVEQETPSVKETTPIFATDPNFAFENIESVAPAVKPSNDHLSPEKEPKVSSTPIFGASSEKPVVKTPATSMALGDSDLTSLQKQLEEATKQAEAKEQMRLAKEQELQKAQMEAAKVKETLDKVRREREALARKAEEKRKFAEETEKAAREAKAQMDLVKRVNELRAKAAREEEAAREVDSRIQKEQQEVQRTKAAARQEIQQTNQFKQTIEQSDEKINANTAVLLEASAELKKLQAAGISRVQPVVGMEQTNVSDNHIFSGSTPLENGRHR